VIVDLAARHPWPEAGAGSGVSVWGVVAYCHSMDVLAWTVVGSVATVAGTIVAIVFGLIPFLHRRSNALPTAATEPPAQLPSVQDMPRPTSGTPC